MGYYKKKIVKISKGQISRNLIERTEIGILDVSGQELTNWQNSKYGAIKTQLPTRLRYSFGAGKKVKLEKILLSNNLEGFLAFNATDHTLTVFDHTGELISNVYTFNQITENNYKNIQVAQNQDLVLLCTGDNPIFRIHIENLPTITAEVFSIPASSILKASNITEPAYNPVLYRMGTDGLPADPLSLGIEVGDYVYPNSGTADPATVFPWSVSRFSGMEYAVTTATISGLGENYAVNDVITANGVEFTITTLSEGASLTINDPSEVYTSDPAGTGVIVSGGSGTGMTVDITTSSNANWVTASWTPNELDLIKDVWNNVIWQFSNNSWFVPSLTATDTHYSTTWRANATTGVIKITGSSLLTITAPAGIDPKKYAESILIGVEFDGENAIGILLITGVTGTISGQNYIITALTGSTIITFDQSAVNTNQTGFTIKFSQVKVFDGDYPNTDNNPSSSTNYPTRILFYQQRLIIAGTRYNLSQMIFSQIAVYDNFVDEKRDDSAFQLVIGSTNKEQIKSVILNNGIQIFTSTAEWLMNDQTITRTSGFVRNSTIGTNGVQPIIAANGVTLFPPKNGKGIIGFAYNYETASFMTPYITLFTDLLDDEITDMMLKRGLDSNDDTLIYICDVNGEMIVGNYLQEHEIQAFSSRKSSLAIFRQVIQCEQDVLFLSERNGVTTLEIIDTAKKTALALPTIAYNNNTGVLNVQYQQYDNQNINVYNGDGDFVGSYLVSNNQIVIPENEKPTEVSEAGFNIHSIFRSNPQNIGNETLSLFKTINTIKLAVTPESRTEYLTINGKYGRREGDLVIYIRPTRPLKKCEYTIENNNYPVEILSIEVELEA